ncbi:MAG: hypothetical protein CL534_11360 [Ahrensia sp.]|nr:hypothetical protein [Ahrensia sp.]
MARPRTPLAKARATGQYDRKFSRFENRKEPEGLPDVGNPPEWMNDAQKEAWIGLADQIPWLNKSHRALLEIACVVKARIENGEDTTAAAMNLLRQCLGQMGATPADASRVNYVPPTADDDPAEQYF